MLPREVPLGLLQPFGGTSRVLSQPLEVGCTLACVRYVYSSEPYVPACFQNISDGYFFA